MSESHNPLNWYGKEFTKKDAAVMSVLMLLCLPIHEFGHWLAYWIFGIPAEFGIMFDPFIAWTVQPLVEPDVTVRLFASFFGGGFVSIVAGVIAIKSKPSLAIMVYGLASGVIELSFVLYSGICGIHHILLVHSNMILYIVSPIIPTIMVFAFGFPEYRWWQAKD